MKKAPPGGFFLRTTSKDQAANATEDALSCISVYFGGLRYAQEGQRYLGWCHRCETFTEAAHSDQIWQVSKCTKRDKERTFVILDVAPDLTSQTVARFIFTEFFDNKISPARTTQIWPGHGVPLGPSRIIVVVQCDSAQEGALIFHQDERFNDYSYQGKGLRCQEPRSRQGQYANQDQMPAPWVMDTLWRRRGSDEMEKRDRTRCYYGIRPGHTWGPLTKIRTNNFFDDLDEY